MHKLPIRNGIFIHKNSNSSYKLYNINLSTSKAIIGVVSSDHLHIMNRKANVKVELIIIIQINDYLKSILLVYKAVPFCTKRLLNRVLLLICNGKKFHFNIYRKSIE